MNDKLDQLEFYVTQQRDVAAERIPNNKYNGQHFEGMKAQCEIILRKIEELKGNN